MNSDFKERMGQLGLSFIDPIFFVGKLEERLSLNGSLQVRFISSKSGFIQSRAEAFISSIYLISLEKRFLVPEREIGLLKVQNLIGDVDRFEPFFFEKMSFEALRNNKISDSPEFLQKGSQYGVQVIKYHSGDYVLSRNDLSGPIVDSSRNIDFKSCMPTELFLSSEYR